MYYLKGFEASKKTIMQTLRTSNYTNKLDDLSSREYKCFLKTKSILNNHTYSDNIEIMNFVDFERVNPDYFRLKKEFFVKNSPTLSERIQSDFFYSSLNRLSVANNEIYELAAFLIKIIVVNQLAKHTNGTTIDTLGLACIDFKDHFDSNDFVELVVHQMTHMLLFMDNFNNPHMLADNYDVMIETNLKYVQGGTKFPAYLAFHSYIVGVEMLTFRKNFTGWDFVGNYHGSTERIFKVCLSFRKSLQQKNNLFTDRGKSFLDDADIHLDYMYKIFNADKVESIC